MKKKIFSLLALVMTAMTASAIDVPSYNLTKTEGAVAHGTVQFNVGEDENLQENVTTAKEGDLVTVIITPDTGYAVDEATGKWYAAVANSRRIQAETPEIELISDITLTPDNSLENTWSFTMERANVQISVTYKHRHVWGFSVVDGSTLKAVCANQSGDCDVPSATVTTEITLPEDIIYGIYKGTTIELDEFNETLAGEAKVELVSTSYAGTLLNSGDAYGPSADVPKFPGNYTVTIKVKAGGNEYTVSKDFTLEQKALEQEMVVPIANCVYNGKVQEPEVSLKYGNEVLKLGKDYVVSYDDNINAGLGIVTIEGLGNFTGTTYATFNILDKEMTADMIEAIADQSYTGQAIEPAVVVKDGDDVLEEGRDYSVTYENNVEVGTATVTVTAWTSGNYRGEVKATFNIVGTTGIGAVSGASKTAAKRYDLGGRRVKSSIFNSQSSILKKGVIIVDGKKVVNK